MERYETTQNWGRRECVVMLILHVNVSEAKSGTKQTTSMCALEPNGLINNILGRRGGKPRERRKTTILAYSLNIRYVIDNTVFTS